MTSKENLLSGAMTKLEDLNNSCKCTIT